MNRAIMAAAFVLFSFQAAAAAGVSWRPPTLARRHYASSLQAPRAGDGAAVPVPPAVRYETRRYTQRLDHFNSLPSSYATFQQRYLINDTFWGGRKAPIFLYAGNEGDVDLFSNNTGLMWEAAPRFRAMVVFAEHRYYGESMPFGGTRDAAYRDAGTKGYLTVTQALADYAELVLSLKANHSAPAAPVVVFGGSYGGMLAAWMRLKYPHVVMGAVASSAPVLGFYGMADPYAFYDRVNADFKSESKNCYDVLRKSWDALYNALESREGPQAVLRRTFNMCNGSSVWDIPYLLQGAVVEAAVSDYPTPSGFLTPLPAYPVRAMCRAIDDRQAAAAASSGDDDGNNSTAALLLLAHQVRDVLNVYYNHTGTAACFGAEDDDPYGMNDGWTWQACTEVMVMAYGIRNGTVLDPSPFNFTAVLDNCRNLTGLPPRPFWMETEFGGYDIANVLRKSASNIIFFNGLRDPWSTGGVLKSISGSIIALVEPKGAHHVDLRFSSKDDPEWLKEVRVKEMRIIAHWLKQYYIDERIAT